MMETLPKSKPSQYTRPVIRLLCLILVSLITWQLNAQEVHLVPRRALGAYYLGQNIGDAVNAYADAARAGKEADAVMAQRLREARARFWAAFDRYAATDPQASEFRDASKQLARVLWEQDFALFLLAFPEGPYGKRTELTFRMVGGLDGWIHPTARSEFNKWILAAREDAGAHEHGQLGGQPDIAIISAGNYEPILRKSADAYDKYQLHRDWAEYKEAGKNARDFYGDIPNFIRTNIRFFSTRHKSSAGLSKVIWKGVRY